MFWLLGAAVAGAFTAQRLRAPSMARRRASTFEAPLWQARSSFSLLPSLPGVLPSLGADDSSSSSATPLVLVGPDHLLSPALCSELACLGGRRRRVVRRGEEEQRQQHPSSCSSLDVQLVSYAEAARLDTMTCVSILLNDGAVDELAALREATKYEIPVYAFRDDPAFVAREIARIDSLAREPKRPEDTKLAFGDDTFFLSLTYEDLATPGPDVLREFGREVDMLEVRADLLGCVQRQQPLVTPTTTTTKARHSKDVMEAAARACCSHVLEQLSALRKDLDTAGLSSQVMPVLFTARSRNQCGALVDDATAVYALAAAGARAGVEWIDVEANWPALERHAFVEWLSATYPSTRILGSLHVVDDDHHVGQAAAVRLLHSCALGGRADAVKLVVKARDARDTISVRAAAEEADLGQTPSVAICLGDAGRLSRVLNRAMTPVTHDRLPTAAPGQLAAKTLMALRRQLFLEPRDFTIVGGDEFAALLLKKAHDAAFARVGLPHRALVVGDDDALLTSGGDRGRFGGAAFLGPLPVSNAPVDCLSAAARAVGFVDTVCVVHERLGTTVRRGEHVASAALANAVSRKLRHGKSSSSSSLGGAGQDDSRSRRRRRPQHHHHGDDEHAKKAGLVLTTELAAANSAAVALDLLGLTPVFLKDDDASTRPGVVDTLDEALARDLAVVVVGGDATLDDDLWARLEDTLSSSSSSSSQSEDPVVVVDLDHAPPRAALRRVVDGLGLAVDKKDFLLEVALEQQKLWTSRRPPRPDVARAIFE
mmetsp:Transcript_2511/g.7454  ORF Transcript_2511/g.7454 Transcript_2511/m.7454 type:complete len:769 (+) Transcript_2511:35-2341(+)